MGATSGAGTAYESEYMSNHCLITTGKMPLLTFCWFVSLSSYSIIFSSDDELLSIFNLLFRFCRAEI
jgi:hypothetical protein